MKNLENCTNAELLSVLLGKTAAKRISSQPLSVLFGITPRRWMACESRADYCSHEKLLVAGELMKRALYEVLTHDDVVSFSSRNEVKDYLRLLLGGREKEAFVVIFLDTKNRLIATEELFQGTLDQTVVFPREVVKRALAHNAASVMFCHNHPSGETEPSKADQELTNVLKRALALVDVQVLDHFIVGNKVISLSEEELI